MTHKTEIVDCPRCFKPCGWCSDYRHMHGPNGGKINLPGTRKRCGTKNLDDPCPMCGGKMKVKRTITYEMID